MSERQRGVVVGMNDQGASTRSASRFNAVKHGLTAKTPVLPGEDPAELQAKIDAYKAKYQTRDEVEHDLAALAAMACWQAMRANRMEVAKVTCDIVTRPDADALRTGMDVAGLGRRLLFDRRGPWQVYPSGEYQHKQPRTSDSGEPDDPDEPGKVRLQLQSTCEGIHWLLDRWFELRKPLENESEDASGWLSCQKLVAVRLLGKQPLDAIHDPEVAMVFLASHAIQPFLPTAFDEFRCEIHSHRVENYEDQLDRDEWVAITPANTAAGRAALLAIVDREIERLRGLEAKRAEVAEIVECVQTSIVSEKERKAVANIQRHLASSNRLMLQNIAAIERARRNEADGWEKIRRERAQRREDARRGESPDPRVVLDADGSVRDAWCYEGDVDAGLARWEAKFGPQPCEKYPEHFQAQDGRGWAVPGCARGVAGARPVQDGGRRTGDGGRIAEDGGRRAEDGLDPERGSEGGIESKTGDGELSGLVPVSLMGQGPATKIQNEIGGACGGTCEGGVETCGQGAGGDPSGARDPRRTDAQGDGGVGDAGGESVPLTLTEQGPATNIQNEIWPGSIAGNTVREVARRRSETNRNPRWRFGLVSSP